MNSAALVTGTSRGLGEAIASQLVADGIFVICCARRFSEEQRAWQDQGKVALVSLSLAELDYADAGRIAAALPQEAQDLLYIANAAALGPISLTGSPGRENLAEHIRSNIEGSILLAEAIVRRAGETGASLSVVHVSSGAGKRAIPGWAIYCSSKAALDMYFQVVAAEHPLVRVIRCDPGVIDTQLQATVRASAQRDFPLVDSFRLLQAEGRLQSPSDAANRVLAQIREAQSS